MTTEQKDENFNLSEKVFDRILPHDHVWITFKSGCGDYFECKTLIEWREGRGGVCVVIRFQIADNLDLQISKVYGSRKLSNPKWSGTVYTERKDEIFNRVLPSWFAHFKSQGITLTSEALSSVVS